jgi:putative membrane protein
LWNIPKLDFQDLLILFIPFTIGMVAEILGVNFGLIFGTYAYGENLGWKVLGVPLTIGMNWSILVFATTGIAQKWSKNLLLQSAYAAGLMVGLDLSLEIVAPKFDFWEFENGLVPVQNYVGWFSVSFVANIIHLKLFKKHHFRLSLAVFLAFLMFFGIFSF